MRTEVALQALGERRRSLIWWALGVAVLVLLTVAFYPSIRDDTAINEYVKDLPESLRGLFAGGELDIASPAGYLNSQIYALMAPLVFLVFAVGAGAGAVAGEEERGTLDFLLAHPLRRRDYAFHRFLALVALVAALSAVLLATTWLGSLAVDLDIGLGRVLAATVSVGLLAVLFGTLALAAGSVRPGRARAIAVAAGVAVAGWLLDGLGPGGRPPRALAPSLAVLPGNRPQPAARGGALVELGPAGGGHGSPGRRGRPRAGTPRPPPVARHGSTAARTTTSRARSGMAPTASVVESEPPAIRTANTKSSLRMA
jgi:ABC-2 type transport system permease protein